MMILISLVGAIAETFKHAFSRTPKPYGMRMFETPADLYASARLFWGWDAILAMSYKALAELAIALVRRDIEQKPTEIWKERVVDVVVMWEQLTLLWPYHYQHVIDEIHVPAGETARSLLAATMQLLAKDTERQEDLILANLPAAVALAWPGMYESKEFYILKAHKIRRLERKVLKIYRRTEWNQLVQLAGTEKRNRNDN